jgi:AraC-like DNA-binding protein
VTEKFHDQRPLTKTLLVTTMPAARGKGKGEEVNEADAYRLLSSPPQGDFAAALRVVLKSYRADGWLTIKQAAVLAEMSVRSVQRRLADDDRSFSELVDEVRRELATEMLQNTNVSLGEIATTLGYSAEENFIRAFRRWTGRSPGKFRSG